MVYIFYFFEYFLSLLLSVNLSYFEETVFLSLCNNRDILRTQPWFKDLVSNDIKPSVFLFLRTFAFDGTNLQNIFSALNEITLKQVT